MRIYLGMIGAVFLLCGLLAFVDYRNRQAEEDRIKESQQAASAKLDRSTWYVTIPGVSSPLIGTLAETKLPEDERIIGVSVGDSHRAYPISALDVPDMELTPETIGELSRHVVNDMIDDCCISVTYCDRTDHPRVFTSDSPEPVELGVGGWTGDEMLLIMNGTRFEQSAEIAPLEDCAFEVTTWKEWKEQYPDTTVYLGPTDFDEV